MGASIVEAAYFFTQFSSKVSWGVGVEHKMCEEVNAP